MSHGSAMGGPGRSKAVLVGLVALAVGLGLHGGLAPQARSGNTVANPGFEDNDGVFPKGWVLEERAKRKGEVRVVRDRVHGGRWALGLRPNRNNTPDILALNVGQGFPADAFRGQRLRVAGWLAADAGATAVLAAYIVDRAGQPLASVRLAQAAEGTGLVHKEGRLDVPAGSSAVVVVLHCQVEGTSGAAFFDDVVLEADDRATGPASAPAGPLGADVSVDAGTALREIPRALYGHNLEWIHGGNMIVDFRDHNVMSQELVRLTRELGTPLLRFPGGSFADHYHWRDGVGPQASRRETQHQPGGARSRHTFGTDEALAFAEATGARLLITVNANTGTPREAADWVRYVNRQGPSRKVVHWEIGNEFYIKNDDPANAAIPPQEYASRFLTFARAMRQADPTIKLHAIGSENFGRYTSNSFPGWNQEVLTRAAAEMDYLAVHNGYFPAMFDGRGEDARTVYAAMLAAPLLIKRNLETLSRQIETYAPARAAHIKLAVTEWGPFFQFDIKGRWVDHVKTLGSGLFAASALKAFIESPRVEIANAFKLNEPGYMGWIQPRSAAHLTLPPGAGQYLPTAPYYALQMYSRHFGSVLVPTSVSSPTYDSQAVGWVEAVRGVPYLEVVSSRGAGGRTLFLMAINKHLDSPIRARIRLVGFRPDGPATLRTLAGTGIDANTGTQLPRGPAWGRQVEAQPNPRFYQGKPGEVGITAGTLARVGPEFEYSFPARSVTSIEIPGALAAGGSGSPGRTPP